MRKLNLIGISFPLAVMMMAGCNGNGKSTELSDVAQLETLIDRYIESINTCDTAIVSDIWSKGDNVSFIAPSGYYGSYGDIRDRLILGVFEANFTERCLQKESVEINVNGNSAWSEFTWSFRAVKRDSTVVSSKGRETQIFQKSDNGTWKLVHVHYSPLKQ